MGAGRGVTLRAEKDFRDLKVTRGLACCLLGLLGSRIGNRLPIGLLAGTALFLLAEQRSIILGRKMRFLLLLIPPAEMLVCPCQGQDEASQRQQRSELITCGDVRCSQQGAVWKNAPGLESQIPCQSKTL